MSTAHVVKVDEMIALTGVRPGAVSVVEKAL
jgi:hypothetical protein